MKKIIILALMAIVAVNAYSQRTPVTEESDFPGGIDPPSPVFKIEDIYLQSKDYYVDQSLTFTTSRKEGPDYVTFANVNDVTFRYIESKNPAPGTYNEDQWAEIMAANKKPLGGYTVSDAFRKAFTASEINHLASGTPDHINVSLVYDMSGSVQKVTFIITDKSKILKYPAEKLAALYKALKEMRFEIHDRRYHYNSTIYLVDFDKIRDNEWIFGW